MNLITFQDTPQESFDTGESSYLENLETFQALLHSITCETLQVLEKEYDCDCDGELDWTCKGANNTWSTVIQSSYGDECISHANEDFNMGWSPGALETKCRPAAKGTRRDLNWDNYIRSQLG